MFQHTGKWNGLLAIAVMLVASSALAQNGPPSFEAAIWGDGELWATQGLAMLPPPNAHNEQSFDKLYIVTNSTNPDQLPVAEAAPGNPDFNGGRWFAQTVEWTNLGLAGTLLTSYEDILYYYNMGDLTITPGHPDPESATYFECPLRPLH